ncbi:hypothetical protein [Pleionea sp. CnH1-48]|uniref:hypothetical protein n=1 Tax=Pleionea sp. CnH1-48 TaxID=2954494 RepID=UPI002096972A|nr:hypothetical protein [Pleionea sp. CnH1-48]MCO7225944.1 hypothetical protein [Pleionea sp. CnH1-48]
MSKLYTKYERNQILRQINSAISIHGDKISSQIYSFLGKNCVNFTLYKATKKKYKSLSDYELYSLYGAFFSSGILYPSDSDEILICDEYPVSEIKYFIKEAEENIIRQLYLLKIIVRDINQKSVFFHAYRNGYKAYGILRSTTQNNFSLYLRELDPLEHLNSLVFKKPPAKPSLKFSLIHFRDMCNQAGIDSITLQENLFQGNKHLVGTLEKQGFSFNRDELVWEK